MKNTPKFSKVDDYYILGWIVRNYTCSQVGRVKKTYSKGDWTATKRCLKTDWQLQICFRNKPVIVLENHDMTAYKDVFNETGLDYVKVVELVRSFYELKHIPKLIDTKENEK